VLLAINPVGEEDGGEVDVGVVSTVEGAESVAREIFDPFSACGGVEDGIGRHGRFNQQFLMPPARVLPTLSGE